jgi:nondiscriminating aspartyl-tRNA synthetase
MAGRVLSSELPEFVGSDVRLAGWVHRVRDLGGVRFLVVRDRGGLAQAVVQPDVDLGAVSCECIVAVEGEVRCEERARCGVEVAARHVEVLSAAEAPPIDTFRPLAASGLRLETLLEHRAVSLRIPEVLDVFRVESCILGAFREWLTGEGFTEIVTPKLVTVGAEGGAALFPVTYFDRVAFLSQSPQFYKQIMVGSGLERVFEVGHAYRAEKSETSRHVTEFVSLDLEMGFIADEQDVMDVLSGVVRHIFGMVLDRCGDELERRSVRLRVPDAVPRVAFEDACRVLADSFGKRTGLDGDLDTEGEQLLGRWGRRELGSELLFVTGYAVDRRPAYTMPRADAPSVSRSFDLLHSGVEIATGGQRIHDWRQLVEAFERRGIDPAGCGGYLEAFRHGMPAHGGMGMGLERLTKQMLGLANIKEACLFPRDRYRLTP